MHQPSFRDHRVRLDVQLQVHLHQVHHQDVMVHHRIQDVVVQKVCTAIHLVVGRRRHQVHQDVHLVVVAQQNRDALLPDASPPSEDADRVEWFDLGQGAEVVASQSFQKDCFQLAVGEALAASVTDSVPVEQVALMSAE